MPLALAKEARRKGKSKKGKEFIFTVDRALEYRNKKSKGKGTDGWFLGRRMKEKKKRKKRSPSTSRSFARVAQPSHRTKGEQKERVRSLFGGTPQGGGRKEKKRLSGLSFYIRFRCGGQGRKKEKKKERRGSATADSSSYRLGEQKQTTGKSGKERKRKPVVLSLLSFLLFRRKKKGGKEHDLRLL